MPVVPDHPCQGCGGPDETDPSETPSSEDESLMGDKGQGWEGGEAHLC